MRTKQMTKHVMFTSNVIGGVTDYYILDTRSNTVIYRTTCPLSIAAMYVNYWATTMYENPDKPVPINIFDPENRFLTLNVEDYMYQCNVNEFVTVFWNEDVIAKIHSKNGKREKQGNTIDDMDFFIRNLAELSRSGGYVRSYLCESRTMEELVSRIAEYKWEFLMRRPK